MIWDCWYKGTIVLNGSANYITDITKDIQTELQFSFSFFGYNMREIRNYIFNKYLINNFLCNNNT